MFPRVDLLGVKVNNLTRRQAVEAIAGFIESGSPLLNDKNGAAGTRFHQVITANAELVYRAWHDAAILEVVNSASLVTADGSGIIWAARRLGTPLRERVTGIDLTLELAAEASRRGWRLFLFGGEPGVAAAAAAHLTAQYPSLQIAGTSHGYLSPAEEEELLARLQDLQPHLLLVGLGMPQQEFWINRHLAALRIPVGLGVGGTLDVLAGKTSRAPTWVQRAGLEWLYRLVRQPSRWRRQLALPLFAWHILRAANRDFKG